MNAHASRSHSTWAASASARNWQCPGALTLSQFAPEGKESIHAARGTAAHEVSERCLSESGVKEPSDFIGEIIETKSHKVEVDEEIANSAAEYVEYVRELAIQATLEHGFAAIEQHFDLAKLGGPFEAGGTGDAVVYLAEQKRLEIVDLKHGVSVVDVNENKQLRTYALGAMLANPGLDIQHVTATIVQPRAPHKDGRIRSETFHVADLVEWTADLLAAMKRSKQAMDEHAAAGSNTVLLDEWRDKWLKPGKCTFCPVEATCPALRRDAMSVAAVWFDDLDQPRIGNAALDTDPASVARDLDMFPMLEGWISARRALAHSLSEQGVDLPTEDGNSYILVDKIGHRKWIDAVDPAASIVAATGLTYDDIYDRKLKSPAAVEKLIGAKGKPKIKDLWESPVTGKNLVRSDRTSRQPAKSVADKYFEA